jgi:lipoprotein-releasing system permease protein
VREWLFTRLDWLIAWRHLRKGDELPPWLRPLTIGAIYLIAVGAGMAWYATTLDAGVGPEIVGPFEVPGTDPGPTALQRYYGAFGGLTLVLGVMALTFAALSWFFNLLPTIITMSVLLGCMALVVVLSLMSGLEGDLRDKILSQKAHIRVSRSDGRPFGDYEKLADALVAAGPVAGASPYLEGEIMVRSGLNRQGAILSGIMSDRHTTVSNLPALVREGDFAYLDHPEDIPDPDPFAIIGDDETPWRLRHLDKDKKADQKRARSFEGQQEKVVGLTPPARRVDPDESDDAPEDVPPEEAPPLEDGEDDEGWEDPAVELDRMGAKPGLLSSLPPPPPSPTIEVVEDENEGWEDPAAELEELREAGQLPAGLELPDRPQEPDADPTDEGEDDGASDDGDEPDNDDAVLDPILIGRELSMELGVRVGAQVQLITPVGRMTPAGRIPGVLGAQVAGVFFSGMYEYDRKNVYAPLSIVQRFLRTGDQVTGVEVKLVDVERIDEGKAAVQGVVDALGRDDLTVEDWRDLNRNLFSAMFLEKVAMFIALLFVVLVASFGILASNLMSVMEKSKEIAILKAMGTSDGGILRVFVAEGLCVGVLGSFGGIGMGLALCWALDRFGLPLNENVYYIEKLPVVVNPFEVALVGGAALVIVCFSSLYPALVASRLRPVDGLRQADQ